MRLDELVPRIKYLLKFERTPDMLIVDCGGNNLGYRHLHKLRHQIKSSLYSVQKMLPNVKIIWSQILPRLSWRSSKNTWALSRVAARINNFAGWLCLKYGGGYVKYPEIEWDEPGLFNKDGVHLSLIGNELQHFLQEFV